MPTTTGPLAGQKAEISSRVAADRCGNGRWDESAHACHCHTGYTGHRCDELADAAASATARCVNGIVYKDKCQCSSDYSGAACSTPICNGHGRPEGGAGNGTARKGAVCLCDGGWKQPFCDRCSLGHMGDDCSPLWYITAGQLIIIIMVVAASIFVYRIRAAKRARELSGPAPVHQPDAAASSATSLCTSYDYTEEEAGGCCSLPLRHCVAELLWCVPRAGDTGPPTVRGGRTAAAIGSSRMGDSGETNDTAAASSTGNGACRGTRSTNASGDRSEAGERDTLVERRHQAASVHDVAPMPHVTVTILENGKGCTGEWADRRCGRASTGDDFYSV